MSLAVALSPLGCAETQSNLGKALSSLSRCGSRTTNLEEAVAAYQSTALSDGEATRAS